MAVMAGEWKVRKIERRLSAKRFLEWEAYAQLEPFDARRGDYRAASIAAVIANVNRDPKKQTKPFTVEDFVLQFGGEDEKPRAAQKQPWQQKLSIAKAIVAAYGKSKEKSV